MIAGRGEKRDTTETKNVIFRYRRSYRSWFLSAPGSADTHDEENVRNPALGPCAFTQRSGVDRVYHSRRSARSSASYNGFFILDAGNCFGSAGFHTCSLGFFVSDSIPAG
jgi:hypothetical protein